MSAAASAYRRSSTESAAGDGRSRPANLALVDGAGRLVEATWNPVDMESGRERGSPALRAPRVAAIILSYNGRDLTLQSVASVSRMRYPGMSVVVVDNGSTDGTEQAVAAAAPGVVVLRTPVNLGPAGGLNLGIRWALSERFDYLLLLNNDIEVDVGMLGELMRVAESDPSIGCVGPKIYYHGDRRRLWSAGGVIRFKHSVTRERGMDRIDRGQYDRTEEVDYVNGCAILVRRAVMEEVGLWDPIYQLGVEDADWCMRMKRCGYRCVYAHRAFLWHMVARSTGVYRPGKTFHTGRSSTIFVRRFARPWQWATFLLFTAAALPAAFLRELPRGNAAAAVAKAKGVLAGLRVPLSPPPRVEDAPVPIPLGSAGSRPASTAGA